MNSQGTELPLVADCQGCGVCCFHMGYPPFIRPIEPLSPEQIESDESLLAEIAVDPLRRRDLLQGREGEKWWFRLPNDLRNELDEYIANYQHKNYGEEVESFDGPCCWFDMETRQCRHHQYRPNVCRDFETGSQQCHEWRRHYREKIQHPQCRD